MLSRYPQGVGLDLVCVWGGVWHKASVSVWVFGGGVWHKALVVGSVSLWRRLLASRP